MIKQERKDCNEVKKNGRHSYKELENGKTACICGRILSINEEKQKKFDEKIQEIEAEKAEIVEETVEKPSTWIDSIDFNQMFRIKGKKGLFSPCTAKNKSGMVLFEEFLDPKNRIWKHAISVDCLANYQFPMYNEEFVGIRTIFENIEKAEEEALDPITDVKNIIFPGYHPEKFKNHHANRILEFYKYMKNKMVAFVEEGEKEMKEESEKED